MENCAMGQTCRDVFTESRESGDEAVRDVLRKRKQDAQQAKAAERDAVRNRT
jgi:uncharacterized protein (UPF0335 family)